MNIEDEVTTIRNFKNGLPHAMLEGHRLRHMSEDGYIMVSFSIYESDFDYEWIDADNIGEDAMKLVLCYLPCQASKNDTHSPQELIDLAKADIKGQDFIEYLDNAISIIRAYFADAYINHKSSKSLVSDEA